MLFFMSTIDQILASRLADKASTLPIRLNRDPTEPTPTRSNTTPAPSHVTPKVQEESNSDSDSMEELVSGLNYVYLQNGSILANETWDAEHGLMVKGEVLMLKISPGGLTFESDSSDITVTVQKVDLIDISRSQEFGDVSLMVKCSGSPAPPVVSLPMRIELYHCAILSSKENVKPVLWFNKGEWCKNRSDRSKSDISKIFNRLRGGWGGSLKIVQPLPFTDREESTRWIHGAMDTRCHTLPSFSAIITISAITLCHPIPLFYFINRRFSRLLFLHPFSL